MGEVENWSAHLHNTISTITSLLRENDIPSGVENFNKAVAAVRITAGRPDLAAADIYEHLEGNEEAVVFLIKSGAV